MADRFSVSTLVGGELPADKVEEFLLIAVEQDGASMGWGAFLHTREGLEAIHGDTATDPLLMFDDQHSGNFDGIEAFCMANGLPFHAHTSAKYEFDGELRWWEPGMAEPATATASENGEPLLSVRQIRDAIGENVRDPEERLEALEQLLADYTPSPLPPLRIVSTVRQKRGVA